MSITQIGGRGTIPIGAKAYGLTIGEPSTQWWSTAITPGVSKAWSSWVQLVAATSEDVLLWLVFVVTPRWNGGEWGALSIGTGAAASEVEVLSLPLKNAIYSPDIWIQLPVPILIPSGTRIAARMALNYATTQDDGYVALGHIKASVVSSY